MSEDLEIFKKKLLYRASYRGTKELDLLLGSFLKKYINSFDYHQLKDLESFLKYDDEIIIKYYNFDIIEKDIDKNPISKIFKRFTL